MLMIPEPTFTAQTPHWQHSLAESFRSTQELLKYCELDINCPKPESEAGFPFRVTRYYASLIEKRNPQDPLLLQILPDSAEQLQVEGYTLDAVGDIKSMPVAGLIHKYRHRALLTTTAACPIHCRYCFRRHFPYEESRLDIKPGSAVFQYLSEHTEINEIILSGGDPLMLSDSKIADTIMFLNDLKHIRYLRIHSRLLSVLPERITDSFIQTLRQFTGKLILVTHINHPNEISEFNQQACRLLTKQGVQLFNQSVLLKKVNDNAETLIDLSYKLFETNIIPYYLHKLDKVHGAAHFDIPTAETCKLYTQLVNSLPGYLVPKLVNDLSGQQSKTSVQCTKDP